VSARAAVAEISVPLTNHVADLAVIAYELALHGLTRFFTRTDETAEQLGTPIGAAFGLMAGVVSPTPGHQADGGEPP
jgi:hypothetical protein